MIFNEMMHAPTEEEVSEAARRKETVKRYGRRVSQEHSRAVDVSAIRCVASWVRDDMSIGHFVRQYPMPVGARNLSDALGSMRSKWNQELLDAITSDVYREP